MTRLVLESTDWFARFMSDKLPSACFSLLVVSAFSFVSMCCSQLAWDTDIQLVTNCSPLLVPVESSPSVVQQTQIRMPLAPVVAQSTLSYPSLSLVWNIGQPRPCDYWVISLEIVILMTENGFLNVDQPVRKKYCSHCCEILKSCASYWVGHLGVCVFCVFFLYIHWVGFVCTYTGWVLFVCTLGGFCFHVHWVGFVHIAPAAWLICTAALSFWVKLWVVQCFHICKYTAHIHMPCSVEILVAMPCCRPIAVWVICPSFSGSHLLILKIMISVEVHAEKYKIFYIFFLQTLSVKAYSWNWIN